MVLQIVDFLARINIPKLHHLVITSGSDEPTVRTPGNGVNAILMADQCLEKAARLKVPDFDFSFELRRTAGSCEKFAVWTEGDGAHIVGVPGERGKHIACSGVDQTN